MKRRLAELHLAPEYRASVSDFTDELLRWNRQINLVSRDGPRQVISVLRRQCEEMFLAFVSQVLDWNLDDAVPRGAADAPESSLRYLDLGSGAGFPGLIWHASFLAALDGGTHVGPRSWLVEPRGKRAWFLERQVRRFGWSGVGVICDRWGGGECMNTGVDGRGPLVWVISSKALRLEEAEVISGWCRFEGRKHLGRDSRLIICRFLPGEIVDVKGLALKYGICDSPPIDGWERSDFRVVESLNPATDSPKLLVTSYVSGAES